MKLSLRWLADWIDLPLTEPKELARVLVSLGHEVERIHTLPLGFTQVTTAQVLEIKTHPNAEQVRLTRVDTGSGEVEVVCGAWNFEALAKVAWAQPGAQLPGGIEIGARQIRGVQSNGMLCSERELGLGDDAQGIMVLDPELPVGLDFGSLVELPDTVLELSITPNRGDCMSMLGIARELSAYYQIHYRLPEHKPPPTSPTNKSKVTITDYGDCYRFVAGEMDGIKVAPSSLVMSQRLRAAGVRPISNVVDISNYVMLELGQPLHIFDLDLLSEPQLIIRRAEQGEQLVTLDEVTRDLTPEDLVVADPSGPVALAGIMGGASTGVNPDTKRVLIEAATWHPPLIMYRSRHHDLRSQASARFERGVDPDLGRLAVLRTAQLLSEQARGELRSELVDKYHDLPQPGQLTLSLSWVERLLGEQIPKTEVSGLLSRLGLTASPTENSGELSVYVPTYRPDLTRPADLVEEIARLRGYDKLGSTTPVGPAGGWSHRQQRQLLIGKLLTGAGLSGAVPLTFMRIGDLDRLSVPSDDTRRSFIRVKNPLREEESVLRTTLLPGLLRAVAHNLAHGSANVGLFEMGRVFLDRTSPTYPGLPDQPWRLAWVIAGEWGEWSLDGERTETDIFVGTALWRFLSVELQLPSPKIRAETLPGFHPGRTAVLNVSGQDIGLIGEIHPMTAKVFGLEGRVLVAELDLDPLLEPTSFWRFQAPSAFPPANFDLAFVLPTEVTASVLLELARRSGGELVEQVSIFDEFQSPSLGEGRRSLALKFVLRAPDRTLDNQEIAEVLRRVTEAAQKELGAELRGEI